LRGACYAHGRLIVGLISDKSATISAKGDEAARSPKAHRLESKMQHRLLTTARATRKGVFRRPQLPLMLAIREGGAA
jgi:hypothetical protein